MTLVWKLLRQHVSIPQLAGFFFANLLGMMVILLAFQFYNDVMPVFTSPDSFMRGDYKIVSKSINMGTTLSGRSQQFYQSDIDNLAGQDFVVKTAAFTPSLYKTVVAIGISGKRLLSTEIYFESIPDEYVDIPKDQWKWSNGDNRVPIVLPRSYINMYNFGFARSASLPRISDNLVGMIDVDLTIISNNMSTEMKGKVVGFSNRLSAILVPQSFIDWSNNYFAPNEQPEPSRLIVECSPTSDSQFQQYLEDNGLEAEEANANNEKAASFLRLTTTLVVAVGLLISALSLYILLLSIYLLVQKNSTKMQNLLLIGYSPNQVARPYQMLSTVLMGIIVVLSLCGVLLARNYYLPAIEALSSENLSTSMLPSVLTGFIIAIVMSSVNAIVVYRKVLICRQPLSE